MSDLMLQRKDVQLVINFPIHEDFSSFEYSLSNLGCSYAYIVHDKDVKEDGELKTKHIHLVMSFLKRHQLKYYIRLVCDYLKINENQVSIQPCDSVAYAIQYLIHKNNSDKYQYDVSSVRSNINEGILSDYFMEDINIKFSTQDIIDICVQSKGNRLSIIQKIGIQRYTLYRNTINDIYKSLLYIDRNYE